MAWSIVGASSIVITNPGTLTLSEPAGCQAGDLMVAVVSYRGTSNNVGTPAGWTRICTIGTPNDSVVNSASVSAGVCDYIIRGASAPALGWTHPAAVAMAGLVVYRGAALSLSPTFSGTPGSNTTTPSTPGLTTAEADVLLVGACCAARDFDFSGGCHSFNATSPNGGSGSPGSIDTTTAPSSTNWRMRARQSTPSGSDVGLAIVDAVKAAAGSTGAFGCTVEINGGHAMILAAFGAAEPAVAGRSKNRSQVWM